MTGTARKNGGFVICTARLAWFFVYRMISVFDGQQGAPAPDEKNSASDTGFGAGADSGRAFVLGLSVLGCEPPVWRRVVVREDMWLQQLHDAIQIAFDWFDYQTHAFIIGESHYGNPVNNEAGLIEDDRDVTLEDIDLALHEKIFYRYNFDEGWTVEINVEKIIPVEKGARYPSCVAGGRAGPPEDCGGVEAYHGMIASLKEPHSEMSEEWREWLGPEYDPERCDLREINKALAGIGADK